MTTKILYQKRIATRKRSFPKTIHGRFPIENECFAYSECEQGTPTKVDCPPGKQRCAKIQTRHLILLKEKKLYLSCHHAVNQ